MKILGLIPARGGSKGIPDKNRKLLNKKPLLQYTIDSALNSKMLHRVIFSSEDKELINIASDLGVEVPFIRPYELATDKASSLSVVKHAVQTLSKEGYKYDAVCLLQVTNPFRLSSFIDEAIIKFKGANTDSLISVLEVPHEYNPHWVYELSDQDTLKIATGEEEIIKRRQELPKAFIRDGSIYITKTTVLFEQNSLYGKSISYINSDPARHINIDSMADWKKAEAMISKLEY
jgi:CMP-N-acetylneuraminic acid synthetase